MRSAGIGLACLLAAGVLAGCSGSPSVAALAGDVAPFAELQDVRLGMKARELEQARPSATPAAYVGYEERLSAYHLYYGFPGSHSEEQQVSPNSRMRTLGAMRPVPGDSAPVEAWRATVLQVERATGEEADCESVTTSAARGVEARMDLGRTEILVSAYSASTDPPSAGGTRHPAHVSVRLRRKSLAERWFGSGKLARDKSAHEPLRQPLACPATS